MSKQLYWIKSDGNADKVSQKEFAELISEAFGIDTDTVLSGVQSIQKGDDLSFDHLPPEQADEMNNLVEVIRQKIEASDAYAGTEKRAKTSRKKEAKNLAETAQKIETEPSQALAIRDQIFLATANMFPEGITMKDGVVTIAKKTTIENRLLGMKRLMDFDRATENAKVLTRFAWADIYLSAKRDGMSEDMDALLEQVTELEGIEKHQVRNNISIGEFFSDPKTRFKNLTWSHFKEAKHLSAHFGEDGRVSSGGFAHLASAGTAGPTTIKLLKRASEYRKDSDGNWVACSVKTLRDWFKEEADKLNPREVPEPNETTESTETGTRAGEVVKDAEVVVDVELAESTDESTDRVPRGTRIARYFAVDGQGNVYFTDDDSLVADVDMVVIDVQTGEVFGNGKYKAIEFNKDIMFENFFEPAEDSEPDLGPPVEEADDTDDCDYDEEIPE